MERSGARCMAAYRYVALLMALVMLGAGNGCAGPALATAIYLWEGGNWAPADCEALQDQRVVVVCRPPSSQEYRHAGASRSVAVRVSQLLAENVDDIDVVNPREVDNWLDESDWGDFKELADAVRADMVVHVELGAFELFKGKTLYQGNADVTVTVYDMNDHGKIVWERHLGEILYPTNSGIPAQDKPVQQFEREFVEVVAGAISRNFHKHDPHAMMAMDALANR
jgi:hypothetical protein